MNAELFEHGDAVIVTFAGEDRRGQIIEVSLTHTPPHRSARRVKLPLRMPYSFAELSALGATVRKAETE